MTQVSELYVAGMRGESYDLGIISDGDMQTARVNTSALGAWDNPQVRRVVGQQDTGCSGCTATAKRTSDSRTTKPIMLFRWLN